MKKYYIKYVDNGVYVVLLNGDICYSGSLQRCCAHVRDNTTILAPDPDKDWNTVSALLVAVVIILALVIYAAMQ